MSSDEEFSLVSEDDLQKVLNEIKHLKLQHEALLKDHKLLKEASDNNVKFAQQFQQRSAQLRKNLEEEEKKHNEALKKDQERLESVKKEKNKLMLELIEMEQDLTKMNETNHILKQQTEVSTAVPEKKVVFKGETCEVAQSLSFDVKPNIVYPMEGGTALITFEDAQVAEKILSLMDHVVEIGDCSITVQAKTVNFLVPTYVEMDTQVCPRRILVSNLPKEEAEERILDKLEIHFSKSRNGGGEVEEIDMLHDSGNVVVTFIDGSVSKGLTDKLIHEVEMERGKKHKVKATPFLNGEITFFQTHYTVCKKTVLLTGIPAIMEQENLQDLLEIHFQKTANSGGEVDAIVYNPVGHSTLAVFEEDSPKEE
ncbi:interferon-induced 35 kDa protein homolog [Electrophorus electricus]|uniref:NID domain-containing protein n=2 Tax=Electrophorus TaxID=8004 RepID=A0A4W4DYL6_ELEEL|nr:interferon-induced 35 kDa protein homolog [Electrophorus electricus]